MDIIYEDQQVLVCYKPAGTAVQNSRIGTMDFISMVKNKLAAENGGNPYVGLVHRLDQPVEGLIVFAKTKQAAASLSAQTAGDEMIKEYLAVSCGVPKEPEGKLEDYLIQVKSGNFSRIAGKEETGAKKAILFYRLMDQSKDKALLRITLRTGRHHQIRVQTANAGFPLYGDKKYNPKFQESKAMIFPALCAARLSFRHPVSKKRMEFTISPRNPVFQEFSME